MTAAGKSRDRGPKITDPISHEEIDRILSGQHHDPHAVLGAHSGPQGTIIRALRPLASSVDIVLPDGSRYPMGHVHGGVFSVTVPADAAVSE